jgi:hypothetical protein
MKFWMELNTDVPISTTLSRHANGHTQKKTENR